MVLRVGYGIKPSDLPNVDIIVSGGGETLAANAAAAKVLGVPNVFCGNLRRLSVEHIRLVIAWSERFRSHPNYLVSLPPSPFVVPRAGSRALGRAPPRLVAVLIGGNTGPVRYDRVDWDNLLQFLRDAHKSHGLRWLVTTSRRSSRVIADALATMAADRSGGIEKFVDYRTAGPNTVAQIFSAADAVLVTADSSTMISEAVGACLPVVGVASTNGTAEKKEEEFRAFLAHNGWYGTLRLSELTPDTFLAALRKVKPRHKTVLEELAEGLRDRLPELFAPIGSMTSGR